MPKDAVVVITGASSGLGQAVAEEFARNKARLVLAARDGGGLQAVAKTCRELGAEVLVEPTDIGKMVEVRRLAEKALSFGRIDVWFSNAGTGAVGKFEDTPVEAHESIIRTNLIGHINDAYAAILIFKKQGRGVFINMISVGGLAAAPFASAYSASKFGLKGFSEALRAELADQPNIHICDVYPTFLNTPGLSHGANYTGRELPVPVGAYSPRKAARAIVRLAANPRPTTTFGILTNVARFAHLIAPNLTTRILAGMMLRSLRRSARTGNSHGNLFGPIKTPGHVEGDLGNGRVVGSVDIAAGAALCIGLLVLWRIHSNGQR